MESNLSSGLLEQIRPLLGNLAQLVIEGSRLSEDVLRDLLRETGLQDNSAALTELQLWGELLVDVREDPTQHQSTVEALQLRGLREAPVLLAIDRVVSQVDERDMIASSQIQVSEEKLNFGCLPLEEGAVQELEVEGGPGRVEVDSDRVRVSPQQFGSSATQLRIEICPWKREGVLSTSLKLITMEESVNVPILAQWQKRLSGTKPLLDSQGSPLIKPHVSLDEEFDRALYRLTFIDHRSTMEERLKTELQAFGLEDGDRLTIHLIGSLADATESGLLIDVAHMIRRQAQQLEIPSLTLQGLLVLPGAHAMSGDLAAQVKGQRGASAAWRELDRFQLVFEHAYPISYGDEVSWRQGKLFERCYLLSTERDDGPGLGNVPLELGLYPAMADAVVALTDPVFRREWEEVAQAISERLSREQFERREALYESLGSFTYILPVEDLVEAVALRLVEQMLDEQWSGGLAEGHSWVIEMLSQTASPSDVPNTALIQDLARRVQMPTEQATTQADAMGIELAALLSPFPDAEEAQESLAALRELSGTGLLEAVRTSLEARAEDYGQDVSRILDEVEQVRERLSALEAYLQACAESQKDVFRRLLIERLAELLNYSPEEPRERGPVAASDFLEALEATLVVYQKIVSAVVQRRKTTLSEKEAEAKGLREALQGSAEDTQLRHPQLQRVLLSSLLPAGAAIIGLGLAALAVPTLSMLLGGVATLATAVGAWLSWRALFRKPDLVRLQEEYLVAEQARLRAEIELRLCTAWLEIVEQWLQVTQQNQEPLVQWQNLLAQVAASTEQCASTLNERRQARRAICVRKYLDDEEIEESLYQDFVAPKLKEDLRSRFVWRYADEEGWHICLHGSQPWEVDWTDARTAEDAMLDIGRAYGSVLRSLQVADVLDEVYNPQSVAEECGPGSTPLIRTVPYEQPISEAHRFVGVSETERSGYFEQVLQHLRAPAAQVHSEQLAYLQHPHRCVTLASLNLLRPKGLPSWSQARQAYREVKSVKRAALHLFPAETNAALYEGLLSKIGLALRFFSPHTCLTLEDERRARAFWMAYAYGWIEVKAVERGGRTPLLQMVLTLPDAEPVPLTESRKERPSFWEAVTSFVLVERGGSTKSIETALRDMKPSDDEERDKAVLLLEEAIERARELQADRDIRKQELGIIMHLVIEDALRRLEGRQTFLRSYQE
jgi:hypothetical protein